MFPSSKSLKDTESLDSIALFMVSTWPYKYFDADNLMRIQFSISQQFLTWELYNMIY